MITLVLPISRTIVSSGINKHDAIRKLCRINFLEDKKTAERLNLPVRSYVTEARRVLKVLNKINILTIETVLPITEKNLI